MKRRGSLTAWQTGPRGTSEAPMPPRGERWTCSTTRDGSCRFNLYLCIEGCRFKVRFQREKIGLSLKGGRGRRVLSPLHTSRRERHAESVSFIRNSFKRKECVQFTERLSDSALR